MKIVIATPFYPPQKGVLGMYAHGLEGAFKKRGDTVSVVVFSAIKLPAGLRHVVYFVRLMIAAVGADYIMALDPWSVGQPALYVSKIVGVPLIARIGGDFLWEGYVNRTKKMVRVSDFYDERKHFNFKERAIFRGMCAFLAHARVLFFNSQFQIDFWRPVYGFERAKARVLENYVPPRAESIQPPRGRVFVCAGRANALKNYDTLVRAFARVKERYPDIELDTRHLSRTEHHDRLVHSYAYIIPSISEMNSNNAQDAVIAGKPFIMTEDTGTKERLGDCGLFIDTRSEDALAGAIERLLEAEEYEHLSRACRDFNYVHSWDDIVREICSAI